VALVRGNRTSAVLSLSPGVADQSPGRFRIAPSWCVSPGPFNLKRGIQARAKARGLAPSRGGADEDVVPVASLPLRAGLDRGSWQILTAFFWPMNSVDSTGRRVSFRTSGPFRREEARPNGGIVASIIKSYATGTIPVRGLVPGPLSLGLLGAAARESCAPTADCDRVRPRDSRRGRPVGLIGQATVTSAHRRIWKSGLLLRLRAGPGRKNRHRHGEDVVPCLFR